jgi:hypothetical protein
MLRPVVTLMSPEPDRSAAFWSALVPAEASAVRLAFEPGPTPAHPEPLHLHLGSPSPGTQAATVARALDLGAAHLDVGQLPEEGHVVLADPDGRAFCVIEEGNRWLAGCGLLGEVSGDGSPVVGRFWSQALGWPLLFDEGGETAVQSPGGGTKLAWSGDRASYDGGTARLDLTGPAAATDRLVVLGATLTGEGGEDWIGLRDPDGAPLRLRLPRPASDAPAG